MSRYWFECQCPKCISPVEEDGLMLSLQCFDPACRGALVNFVDGEILRTA